MAWMTALARLEASLDRVKQNATTMDPPGPFASGYARPLMDLVRDAQPDERQMFRYTGPSAPSDATHAPTPSADQPLFEVQPVQQATPLRPAAAKSQAAPEPEVLLKAALVLVDSYHAMPRKRNLIIDQLEKCQMLRFSISDIQHEIDSVEASNPSLSLLDAQPLGDDPSAGELQGQIESTEAECASLESELRSLRELRDATRKQRAPPPPAPTPKPAAPPTSRIRSALLARSVPSKPAPAPAPASTIPPSRSQPQAQPPRSRTPSPARSVPLQTPTISRFLSLSTSTRRTPSAGEARAERDLGHEDLLGDDVDMEGMAKAFPRDSEDEHTVMGARIVPSSPARPAARNASPPPPPSSSTAASSSLNQPPSPPADAFAPVEAEESPAPESDAGIDLDPEVGAVLTKLAATFQDVILQSPVAPPDAALGEVSPSELLFYLHSLSLLPLPSTSAPSSSASLLSSSSPLHPATSQGILLSRLFLALLRTPQRSLPLGLAKRTGELVAGQAPEPGADEEQVKKVIYWGVGKKALKINRASGGEARVEFA